MLMQEGQKERRLQGVWKMELQQHDLTLISLYFCYELLLIMKRDSFILKAALRAFSALFDALLLRLESRWLKSVLLLTHLKSCLFPQDFPPQWHLCATLSLSLWRMLILRYHPFPGSLLTPATWTSSSLLAYSHYPANHVGHLLLTSSVHSCFHCHATAMCVCEFVCVCVIAGTGESGGSDSAPSQGHVQGESSQLLCRSELMAFKGIAPMQSH